MSAFIETVNDGCPLLVNLDNIAWVCPYGEKCTELRFCFGIAIGAEWSSENWIVAEEPFDSLKAKIFAATVKEEKGKIPHTPLKEKGETRDNTTPRARTRGTFVKPTVEEVAAHIREKGYTFDAEEFWNFYESKGWRVGSHVMKSWTSACVTWQKTRDREERREAARTAHIDAKLDERTAHIDAKMDEREAKRERRAGGGRRKADNNVEMSDEVREEVRRDFDL